MSETVLKSQHGTFDARVNADYQGRFGEVDRIMITIGTTFKDPVTGFQVAAALFESGDVYTVNRMLSIDRLKELVEFIEHCKNNFSSIVKI